MNYITPTYDENRLYRADPIGLRIRFVAQTLVNKLTDLWFGGRLSYCITELRYAYQ